MAPFPEIAQIFDGNKCFRNKIDHKLLQKLTTEGQSPDFVYFGCSDSRVPENMIFDAQLGTFFTQRNIANLYSSNDASAAAVLAYGIKELGVGHVIVMGHYGCGGVAASIADAPKDQTDSVLASVYTWIEPIKKLYQTSTRTEIVSLRNANANKPEVGAPKYTDPGFRALVEENVKRSVETIVADAAVQNNWAEYKAQQSGEGKPGAHGGSHTGKPLKPVFVHGFVYDLQTGCVTDLGVSQGPQGTKHNFPGVAHAGN